MILPLLATSQSLSGHIISNKLFVLYLFLTKLIAVGRLNNAAKNLIQLKLHFYFYPLDMTSPAFQNCSIYAAL